MVILTHSTLWGHHNDTNGKVVEDIVEEKDLVVLNNGSRTSLDLVRGTESCLDITMVSQC